LNNGSTLSVAGHRVKGLFRRGMFCAIFLLFGCDREPVQEQLQHFSGSTMGTFYTLKVLDLPTHLNHQEVSLGIERQLQAIDSSMSTYREDSELSRFNASRSSDWFSVSPALSEVVREALEVSTATDGAFDITVGPLVNLWGFGPSPHQDQVPSDEEIDTELSGVGYQHVQVRSKPPALRKERAEIYIDLSAIAKGYAVDKVATYLESLGVLNYMIEIGGELRLKGHNDHGDPWRIAVERPSEGVRDIHTIIQASDDGVATSGDYRNYFEEQGRRYSHTINPRTGRPVTHSLASVTVISDSAMYADAMATALMVIGTGAGFQLAERQGLAAYFISHAENGFAVRATSAFAAYQIDQE